MDLSEAFQLRVLEWGYSRCGWSEFVFGVLRERLRFVVIAVSSRVVLVCLSTVWLVYALVFCECDCYA